MDMARALNMGIQPSEFKQMEAWELEGLMLIMRYQNSRERSNDKLRGWYASKGINI